MECLAETLWRAERDRRLPDERAYLDCLGRMCKVPGEPDANREVAQRL
jgi:hypothetical protein